MEATQVGKERPEREINQRAQLEKTKDEDDALRQKAVTYIQHADLKDFGEDHLFRTDLE